MTLEQYSKKKGPLNKKIRIFSDILVGIIKALTILSEKGIIHRDIRPSNIFVNPSVSTIKLGGFGCAIFSKENINEPIGSLYYTAPEIIKKLPYDEKCDLWSVGVILYEILFGYLPYGKNVTPNLIKEIIYREDYLLIGKTDIPQLNDLFKVLLTINRKFRITCNDLLKRVNKNFVLKESTESKKKNKRKR